MTDPVFTVIHPDAPGQPSTLWSSVNADGSLDLWDGGVHLLENVTPPETQHFLQHGYTACPDGVDKCPLGPPIYLS